VASENATFKGLTEDRSRSLVHRFVLEKHRGCRARNRWAPLPVSAATVTRLRRR
jgi:hypothetical protein